MREKKPETLFGRKLRHARKVHRLTQVQLAEKLGVPYQYIQRWERGAFKPGVTYQGKLADVFDIDMETFLREWMGEDG